MVQTLERNETANLLEKITASYSYFHSNNDKVSADKARQLGRKINDGEFSIALCGHFSAGKSSMINTIVGENLLPSSPIPTSANLVKVKVGEEYAKVFFKNDNPKLYPAPYDFEKVKTYCKDGDQIHSIEISHATNALPKETVILDTPGIDSTDDAHRIATESALHLADLVFYVMDYNHVQSELNFLFTKELTEAGKEVYLVINQIDKHREEELSFEQFQQSVKDSFASWGVTPAQIFYTSLKVQNHPHNEFEKLKSFIHSSIARRGEILPISVFHSLKKLTEEHLSFMKEKDAENLAQIEAVLSELTADQQDEIRPQIKAVQTELAKLKGLQQEYEQAITKEIEQTLKNAYLMPFQTRELAEAYLQATQADFKVGLFFAKQKTEHERSDRLDRFFVDFQDKVKSQLEWHLKEVFSKFQKTHDIHDSNLQANIQSFTFEIDRDVLVQNVKTGARMSGDYVLNYTNDCAESVKKLARQKVSDLKEQCLQLLKQQNTEKIHELQEKYNEINNFVEALNEKDQIITQQTSVQIKLEHILNGDNDENVKCSETEEMLKDTDHVEVVYDTGNFNEEVIDKKKWQSNHQESLKSDVNYNSQEMREKLVAKLIHTSHELKIVPGFKRMSTELHQKAERLKSDGYTVALFGAFSAGKSSFANALIGEKLLPVSPNPTTAAINKIMPINETHKHGTVLVKLKESDVLFEDVNRSLGVFQLTAANFSESIPLIQKVMENKEDFDANEKTHFAFLNAFSKGIGTFESRLGEVIETDLSELKEFVANEEKSCLVELIEVYYDCELTRKGITLVDTPGADSINARHTGVAFDYIKNSDAILFVTYYNHAFSKADREFLIQLGRVKDSFELDKMFFIVNAIDLASDEDEMSSVMNYVEDQLIQYGIRKPNLYALSSMLAIQEKMGQIGSKDSRIVEFEKSFYSFITTELMEVANKRAEAEWQRAVNQLQAFIVSSKEDKDVRAKKREILRTEQVQYEKMIEQQSFEILQKRLTQELDELIYYIKQRVFFRYSDFFKETFNPSVLKDDGRNLKKALNSALEDFLASFGFDFAQELRATSIRIESFIHKISIEAQDTISKDAIKINQELSFSPFEIAKMDSIEFPSAFSELDRNLFKKALSYFKNPKSFFEKNEKKYFSDELERVLDHPAEEYLSNGSSLLQGHYVAVIENEFKRLLQELLEQGNEYFEGMLAAISDEISIEQLEEIEYRVTHFHTKD